VAGVFVGGHALTATAGMLVWGVALGIAGVYGEQAAAMALPVAWMFLELGLSAPSHTLWDAARQGALVLVGGMWAIALAWGIKAIGPDRPLVERTARCFALLADYLDHALGDGNGRPPQSPQAETYGPSRETRVRSAIADARRLALDTERRQATSSVVAQRLVVLIELADQIFSLGSVLGETREESARSATDSAPGASQRDRFVAGTRAVSRALTTREDGAVAAELARLSASTSGSIPSSDGRAELRGRLVDLLDHALQLAAGSSTPGSAMPEAGPVADGRPGLLIAGSGTTPTRRRLALARWTPCAPVRGRHGGRRRPRQEPRGCRSATGSR
jgi:uncharacterized membrane protein YccC